MADGWGACAPLATKDDLCGDCANLDLNDADNLALFNQALGWASERFVMATRGRFKGVCTATIRPASGAVGCLGELVPELMAEAYPLLVADQPTPVFVNCWSGAHAVAGLSLPYLPVRTVVEVVIDGVTLDPGDYFLVPGTNTLRRTDGTPWPATQAATPLADGPGTWSVTFSYGLGAPPSARPLIASYACELAKRCTGQPCDLPEGIRIKSRPGVEYGDSLDIGVLDIDYRDQGLTGYGALDDWIRQLFAGQSRTRPRLWHGQRSTAVRG